MAKKAAVAAANGKPCIDDDNSVNESDTITNTNDEPAPLYAKKEALLEDLLGSDALAEQPDAEDPKSTVAATPKSVVQQADGATAGVSQNAEEAEAEADGSDNNNNDSESLFDLTRIQEGQAFNPETGFLLGKKDVARFGNKKCLILDLDETLVHSLFKYLRTADFVIPVEIDDQVHHVYVIKRPGVDEFLEKVGKWYEVVVFTASVAKYGDPLLNKLDIHKSVHQRLFRDLCFNYQGNFIKNLSQVGRPLQDLIIIDNLPASYIFHPQHSIPILSWFSDTHDNELLDLLPLLEDISKPNVDDVSLVLDITI